MTPNPRRLEQTLAATLARRESASQLRRLTSFPPDHVDFSSNAYLSLSNIPEIRQGFLSSLQSTETSLPPLLGSGGSRLLDGNSPFAEAIESQVARFHKAPSGLLFNSGFDANVGLFSCLPQPGDIIVHDELIHASVHHGMKLSRAKKRVAFKHNCVESADHNSDGELGLKSLDTLLGELVGDQRSPGVAEGSTSVFVAVEGVYSMDGDVAPLQEIVSCVKRHLPKGNGYIIVDEAHSTGLFGAHGSGLVCELGLEQEVFARLNTFGKAMSASGGTSGPSES